MTPRLRRYVTLFILASLVWAIGIWVLTELFWQEERAQMGVQIRNGIMAIAALGLLTYGVHGLSSKNQPAPTQATPPVPTEPQGFNGSPAMLARTGADYVLEVRGMGVVTEHATNREIWQKIEEKADNFATYMSQNIDDYFATDTRRISELGASSNTSFKAGAKHAVSHWPVPVLIWEPPKHIDATRPSSRLAGLRQGASLGVHLLLWEDDANTEDGVLMLERVFAFFDTHPDVPEALLVSQDGSMRRSLLRTPGHTSLPSEGKVIPPMPDSIATLLVARSDRVDARIRPYAVAQSGPVNRNTTDLDITRLWNFYWENDRDQGPDSFYAHSKAQEAALGSQWPISADYMSSEWWHRILPRLWSTLSNDGPGDFTPSPYIPVRWTTWQVRQFDQAPLLGYLHRPVTVSLSKDDGQPLPQADQAAAIKAGWEQAVAALPSEQEPARVFYDTTGDARSVIPLNQALTQIGPQAPDLNHVKEGYDIGRRIGNTGISSPLVQIGLGLVASYQQGGASATVHRRPDGTATLIMVSPPEDEIKAAWVAKTNNSNPFR